MFLSFSSALQGIVKALLDANLLPRVVSGSSAGAIGAPGQLFCVGVWVCVCVWCEHLGGSLCVSVRMRGQSAAACRLWLD